MFSVMNFRSHGIDKTSSLPIFATDGAEKWLCIGKILFSFIREVQNSADKENEDSACFQFSNMKDSWFK